jgi:hypothetical protein
LVYNKYSSINSMFLIINISKLTAPGLATSSFSEFGDSSLTDTSLESLAGAVGVDDVGVVGRGGGD